MPITGRCSPLLGMARFCMPDGATDGLSAARVFATAAKAAAPIAPMNSRRFIRKPLICPPPLIQELLTSMLLGPSGSDRPPRAGSCPWENARLARSISSGSRLAWEAASGTRKAANRIRILAEFMTRSSPVRFPFMAGGLI